MASRETEVRSQNGIWDALAIMSFCARAVGISARSSVYDPIVHERVKSSIKRLGLRGLRALTGVLSCSRTAVITGAS